MGSYLSSSDAQLIALTRLRRSQRPISTPKPCLRAAADKPTPEFKPSCAPASNTANRRSNAMQRWRRRMWKAGVRACFYCLGQMTQIPKHGDPPPSSVTVDHRVALANDGADDPSNWVMCCSRCNNRKGSMSESEFRSVLAMMVAPVAVVRHSA